MSEISSIPETEEPTELSEISMTSKICRVTRTDNDVALKDSLDISRRSTCVDGPLLEQGAGDVILTSVVMQKNGDVLNDGEDVAMKDVTDENKNEPKDGEVSVRGRTVLYGGDLYCYISGCTTFQQQLSHADSRVLSVFGP